MKYDVVITRAAMQDLQDIIDYIAVDNLINAERTQEAIFDAAQKLDTFPDRGRLVPELKKQGIQRYRETIYHVWRIIYILTDESVFISGIFDSRRNLTDILLDRFS